MSSTSVASNNRGNAAKTSLNQIKVGAPVKDKVWPRVVSSLFGSLAFRPWIQYPGYLESPARQAVPTVFIAQSDRQRI